MWSANRTTVAEMRMAVDAFVGERDWRRYHNPINVASALVVEAAELLELFQWRRDGDPVPEGVARAAGEELADVLHYALALANATDAKLAIDSKTLHKAGKLTGASLSKPGAGANEGKLKESAEQVVSMAMRALIAVRMSHREDKVTARETRDLPTGMFDTTKAIEDLFELILLCARVLDVDLARELELKMEKNRKRFPVGSRPDVGY
jgi:NTP pyrophosphatase (non-canonical NTP hydrolase)